MNVNIRYKLSHRPRMLQGYEVFPATNIPADVGSARNGVEEEA